MLKNNIYFTMKSFFYELLRGHFFRFYYYNLIKKNEFSEKNLENYHNKRLKKIGRALGLPRDLTPDQIKKKLLNYPIISKKDIRNNSKIYESKYYKSFLYNYNITSGTTGTPTKTKQSLECIQLEEAFVYRQFKWAGYSFRQKRATIRGGKIISADKKEPPFWCNDYFYNNLIMSSYHISKNTSVYYIDKLEAFNPVLIHAYPSSIYALANWLQAEGKFYKGNLKAILTSSETMTEEMKKIIEERFQCKVYDWYGLGERVAAIGTCEEGNKHLLIDYSLVELIGTEKKEIIGTSLNNIAMPLVRYATGDYLEMDTKKCKCGRIFPVVKKIYGRKTSGLLLPDGRKLHILGFFKGLMNIIEAQVVQKKLDFIIINIVPGNNFSKEDEKTIYHNARSKLGSNVRIKINLCDQIPRGANGKFEFIKSELNK